MQKLAAQNSQLQSALAAAERANEQLATYNLTLQREAADLRRKNAELARRLRAIRTAVEATG